MPSSRLISPAQVDWKAATTSRCSSGSSCVESALDPTMSQNMTVIWRRSACAVAVGFGAVGAPIFVSRVAVCGSKACKLAPHWAQKRSSGAIPWPQDGQERGSEVPHFTQNFEPSRTPTLQFGHCILVAPVVVWATEAYHNASACPLSGEGIWVSCFSSWHLATRGARIGSPVARKPTTACRSDGRLNFLHRRKIQDIRAMRKDRGKSGSHVDHKSVRVDWCLMWAPHPRHRFASRQ